MITETVIVAIISSVLTYLAAVYTVNRKTKVDLSQVTESTAINLMNELQETVETLSKDVEQERKIRQALSADLEDERQARQVLAKVLEVERCEREKAQAEVADLKKTLKVTMESLREATVARNERMARIAEMETEIEKLRARISELEKSSG